MLLFQPGRSVIAKIQETTVWTEIASGIMITARIETHFSRRCCSASVPVHPAKARDKIFGAIVRTPPVAPGNRGPDMGR